MKYNKERVPRKPEEKYIQELESLIFSGEHYNGVLVQLVNENGHSTEEIESITLRNALVLLTVDAMSGSHTDLDIYEAVKYGVHYDPGATDTWTEEGCEAWSDLELANAMAMYAMVMGNVSKASRPQKYMARINYESIYEETGYIQHPNAITSQEIRIAFNKNNVRP